MHPYRRLNRIIREARQFIIDVEWWNKNRDDAPPMDCEDMRVLLPIALKCREALRRGDRDQYTRLSEKMVQAFDPGAA